MQMIMDLKRIFDCSDVYGSSFYRYRTHPRTIRLVVAQNRDFQSSSKIKDVKKDGGIFYEDFGMR